MIYVDLRCPITPRRMFARLLAGEATIVPGNLVEVSCIDCRKTAREDQPDVTRVLHRFNVLGECVETVALTPNDVSYATPPDRSHFRAPGERL